MRRIEGVFDCPQAMTFFALRDVALGELEIRGPLKAAVDTYNRTYDYLNAHSNGKYHTPAIIAAKQAIRTHDYYLGEFLTDRFAKKMHLVQKALEYPITGDLDNEASKVMQFLNKTASQHKRQGWEAAKEARAIQAAIMTERYAREHSKIRELFKLAGQRAVELDEFEDRIRELTLPKAGTNYVYYPRGWIRTPKTRAAEMVRLSKYMGLHDGKGMVPQRAGELDVKRFGDTLRDLAKEDKKSVKASAPKEVIGNIYGGSALIEAFHSQA